MTRLRLAVIGVGHLGKEHARILASLPDVELVGVADVNPEQAQTVARRCGTRAYSSYWPLLNLVDAACIAAPTCEHHAIGCEFLRRGLPVLIEKPLALNREQAEELVILARRHHTILQVGHIERFNPAFEELGRRPFQPKFVECHRLGPFTGRSTDIGAVLDLMIHDLDLLLHLVKGPVVAVEALGASIFGGEEDVAHARLTFANGCLANLTASRASAQPQRCMRLWGPEGYAKVDFARRRLTLVQPSERLRREGLDPRRLDPAARALLRDELYGKYLEVRELDCNGPGDQLTEELREFVRCVRTGASPRVPGEDGRDAVALAGRILEAIRGHRWEGRSDGATGPRQLPPPRGRLFASPDAEAAA
ncbi:MAG: Gfo/Idh/MocA family oxidoreductase [Gemmataceae bacterium]|nr:Gfo/Idh/MocA family oxidoreductase [Gemmataceae bacterium]MDW8266227.1 Gfo/Idh/MocA family oxidoreductase [Gemmataceae bacterium]